MCGSEWGSLPDALGVWVLFSTSACWRVEEAWRIECKHELMAVSKQRTSIDRVDRLTCRSRGSLNVQRWIAIEGSSLNGFKNCSGVCISKVEGIGKIVQETDRTGSCSKDAPTNPRGIPFAPFVDNVEDYVSTRADVEGTLKSFQEMISYVYLDMCCIAPCTYIQAFWGPRSHTIGHVVNTNSWKSAHNGEQQA